MTGKDPARSEQRRSVAELTRAAMKAYDAQNWEAFGAFVHPDATFELVAADGQPVRGRDAILETMRRARSETFYDATVSEIVPLTDTTAEAHGRVRYPLPGGRGHADAAFTWDVELRDGLIWGVRIRR